MANIPSLKVPLRITELDPFESETTNPHAIRDVLYDTVKAAHWYVAMDYKADSYDPTDPSVETPVDYGTKKVPVSRLAFRNESGLIPRQMLPDYVEDVVYGSFVPDSDTSTYAGMAKFVTNDKYEPKPDEPAEWANNYIEYRYPWTESSQTPWLKTAVENLIYMDTDDTLGHEFTNLQFRFKTPGQTQNEFHGFNVLPSTKAIVPGYGILVSEANTTTTIAARKANRFEVVRENQYLDGYNVISMTVQNNDTDPVIPYGATVLVKNATYLITANITVKVTNSSYTKPLIYMATLSISGLQSSSTAQFDIDMSTTENQSFSISTEFTPTGNGPYTMVLGINEQDIHSVTLVKGIFNVAEVL